MSSLWLALTLVGAFLAIFMVGVLLDMFMRERNRTVTLLETSLGQVTDSVDLREEELSGSALDRIVLPTAKRLGKRLVRLTPFDLNSRINEQLILAGSPAGWDPERVVALKIIGGIAGLVGGILLAALLPIATLLKVGFVVLLTLIGYVLPGAQVSTMATKRQ